MTLEDIVREGIEPVREKMIQYITSSVLVGLVQIVVEEIHMQTMSGKLKLEGKINQQEIIQKVLDILTKGEYKK